jgi:TPR repeat protein
MMSCCSKVICNGCKYANWKREVEPKCPFCRHPAPKTNAEAELINTKRVKANDPVAICEMGVYRDIAGDYEGAFQHYTKAAELGNIKAHFQLSCSYRDGEGVEKDEKKAVYHLEQAAIGGEPNARYNLGALEGKMAGSIEQ